MAQEDKKLGLGFQESASPTPDFTDQNRMLSCDRDGELSEKLKKLDFEDSATGEEVRSLGSAPAMEEKGELEEEKQKLKRIEGVISEGQEIGGEIDEKSDEVGDRATVESEDTKYGEAEYEEIDGKEKGRGNEQKQYHVVEENGADFEEVEDGSVDKGGSKWSQIEEYRVVEGNGGNFEEVKDESVDNGGSKWSQVENVEGNYNTEVEEWVENEEGNYNIEVKEWEENEEVEDNEEAIDNYESNWGITEKGNDGYGRFEPNYKRQTFGNYEDYRNGKEQYDDEVNWYENAELNSVGLNDGNYGSVQYPLRPDAEDCTYYMRTGNCKYGSDCKFNHPVTRKKQANEPLSQKQEHSDRPGQTECKYYLTAGGCKYGNSCRYNHGRGKTALAPSLEFNFIGLPIRVGEQECPYYMRNGSCKFGSSCRFNHPDPAVVGGGDSALQGGFNDNTKGWSSAITLTKTAPFVPVVYPPNPTAPLNAEWNGYKAPVYPTSERNLPTPPAFAMNIPANASFFGRPQQQQRVEEFPERPGQLECSYYLRTGDCKYRSSCKFHHPKNQSPRTSPFTLTDQGLPLRPDQSICTHYRRYGLCKYGPSCKFNHPTPNGNSASPAGSYQDEPHQYGNSRNSDGNWRVEPLIPQ